MSKMHQSYNSEKEKSQKFVFFNIFRLFWYDNVKNKF
jgi:hypothetical protein